MIISTISKNLRFFAPTTVWHRNVVYRSSSSDESKNKEKNDKEPEVPVNLLNGMFSAQNQPSTGKIYDKKPFRLKIEAGKSYSWCICGESKSQPLCDGTHKNIFLKIKLRPVRFVVKETKYYWLCNCKRTSNRPFCDGTHLSAEIQELRR